MLAATLSAGGVGGLLSSVCMQAKGLQTSQAPLVVKESSHMVAGPQADDPAWVMSRLRKMQELLDAKLADSRALPVGSQESGKELPTTVTPQFPGGEWHSVVGELEASIAKFLAAQSSANSTRAPQATPGDRATPNASSQVDANPVEPITIAPTERVNVPAPEPPSIAAAAAPLVDFVSGSGVCTTRELFFIPSDYCTSSFDRPCFTGFEFKYMHWHTADLAEGLQVLRAPGCFRHGITVAAMGYYRTGSTMLFNIARLWAALASGSGVVSGFGCVTRKKWYENDQSRRESKCTVVCKDHEWKQGLPDTAEVVLMSHRDPLESLCSRKLMDQFCKSQPRDDKMDRVAWRAACLKGGIVGQGETVRQCHRLMQMQAGIYNERLAAKKTIAYDVLLSDYNRSPSEQIANIGSAMGICQAAIRNAALLKFVMQMAKLLHDKPDKDIGITRMHDTHKQEQRQKHCSSLLEHMRSDRRCSAWQDASGSVEANPFKSGEVKKR